MRLLAITVLAASLFVACTGVGSRLSGPSGLPLTQVQNVELTEQDVKFSVRIRLLSAPAGAAHGVQVVEPEKHHLVMAEVSVTNSGPVSPRLRFTSWHLETSVGPTTQTIALDWQPDGPPVFSGRIDPCMTSINECVLPAGKRVDRLVYFAVPKGARITGIRAQSFLPVIPVDVTLPP